jgi:hypothetical protein
MPSFRTRSKFTPVLRPTQPHSQWHSRLKRSEREGNHSPKFNADYYKLYFTPHAGFHAVAFRQRVTITFTLTEQSNSWNVNSSSASRETPWILAPPPQGSLPCWQKPITCAYLKPNQPSLRPPKWFNTHLNIILRSTPRPSKWSLSLRFPHQQPVRTSPLPHTCHMPRPSHSPLSPR